MVTTRSKDKDTTAVDNGDKAKPKSQAKANKPKSEPKPKKAAASKKRTKDDVEQEDATAVEDGHKDEEKEDAMSISEANGGASDKSDVGEPDEGGEEAEGEAEAEPVKKKPKVADEVEEDRDQEMSSTDSSSGILEKGHIYFFYREKVGLEGTPEDIDDVAKFHMLFVVRGKTKYRFVVIGKKRLPDREKSGREVFWGTVEKSGENLQELVGKKGEGEGGLGERSYETKTRGTRHIPPARLAGRGHYALFSPQLAHDQQTTPSQRRTHLLYHLSHPDPLTLGDVQKELSIHSSGSFILQIKNPTASDNATTATGGRGAGLPEYKKPDLGEEKLDEVFGGEADNKGAGTRFAGITESRDVDLLDTNGTEVLIIPDKNWAGGDDAAANEGEELEKEASKDRRTMDEKAILKELKLDEKAFPPDALDGDWI